MHNAIQKHTAVQECDTVTGIIRHSTVTLHHNETQTLQNSPPSPVECVLSLSYKQHEFWIKFNLL